MSEENRAPEDEQPLANPVHEQRLARPVSTEQEEAEGAEEEQQEVSQVEEEQQQKGLMNKAINIAREKGLVGESTAEKVRETGVVDKADEAIDKAMDKARETGVVDKANEAIDKARNKLTDR